MSVEVSAAKITFMLVKEMVPMLEDHQQRCQDFNSLPNIPWPLREQVRTLEGKLDRVVEDCIEILDKLNLTEAQAFMNERWPL